MCIQQALAVDSKSQDGKTIRLDAKRSFTADLSHKLEKELDRALQCWVAETAAHVNGSSRRVVYTQGMHDIAAVCIERGQVDLALPLLRRVSRWHLRGISSEKGFESSIMMPWHAVLTIMSSSDPSLHAIMAKSNCPAGALFGWTRTWFAHPLRGDMVEPRRGQKLEPVLQCFNSFAANHPLLPFYLASEIMRGEKAAVTRRYQETVRSGVPPEDAASMALNSVFHQDRLPKGPPIETMLQRSIDCMHTVVSSDDVLQSLEAEMPLLRKHWPELWSAPLNAPFEWVNLGAMYSGPLVTVESPVVSNVSALDVSHLEASLKAIQVRDVEGVLTEDGFGWASPLASGYGGKQHYPNVWIATCQDVLAHLILMVLMVVGTATLVLLALAGTAFTPWGVTALDASGAGAVLSILMEEVVLQFSRLVLANQESLVSLTQLLSIV